MPELTIQVGDFISSHDSSILWKVLSHQAHGNYPYKVESINFEANHSVYRDLDCTGGWTTDEYYKVHLTDAKWQLLLRAYE